MAEVPEKIVPAQYEGAGKDIVHSVKAASDQQARKLFQTAHSRLLDVNHWEEIARPVTAKFTLTDHSLRRLRRKAREGDFIMIEIPGPGSSEGKGADWVHIEAVAEKKDASGKEESVAFRVRPARTPVTGENVAHFFDDKATSTFMIHRNGRTVSAFVHGRNEAPNLKTDNKFDIVRNALVGFSAIAGLSDIQWKNLVTGLLKG